MWLKKMLFIAFWITSKVVSDNVKKIESKLLSKIFSPLFIDEMHILSFNITSICKGMIAYDFFQYTF